MYRLWHTFHDFIPNCEDNDTQTTLKFFPLTVYVFILTVTGCEVPKMHAEFEAHLFLKLWIQLM